MSKKKQQTKVTPQSLIMGIIGAIVIAIASYFGIDLSTSNNTTSDTGQVISQPASSANVSTIQFSEGFGAQKSFWQVYFTSPTRSDAQPSETCMGGIDQVVVDLINSTQRTLDIAAFEWKNQCITEAVIAAHNRGVAVRMVVDDEHVIEENEEAELLDEESPFMDIIQAGIPYVDDGRSGLMHNKFMIFDGTTVLTGSMNFTARGTYTNNNNLLVLRSQRAVEAYQDQFNEMFIDGQFGPRGETPNDFAFTQDGIPVRILFSPDDPVVEILVEEINNAQSEIRFMTFSFTEDRVGEALLNAAARGVDVAGVFETRGSETQYSELPALFCAGLDVRQDGNGQTFHHKVFIIDGVTVMTGSFNISDNAITSNDENMVIIRDSDLAAQYLAEYERVRQSARAVDPADVSCR
ncbi:MAG: hypothetical protein CUN56_08685 [Phototrophicales bacterium]|nr:MAG: hypothetical protein CUN56_08685 [Phototrophicales bacterium]